MALVKQYDKNGCQLLGCLEKEEVKYLSSVSRHNSLNIWENADFIQAHVLAFQTVSFKTSREISNNCGCDVCNVVN